MQEEHLTEEELQKKVEEFEAQELKELYNLTEEEVQRLEAKKFKNTHKRNPFTERMILGWLAEGLTKQAAAQRSGITEQTLYNWMRWDPIFKKRVENNMGGEISLKAVDNVAGRVRDGDLDASKWWLSKTRHFEKRYSETPNGQVALEKNPHTGVFEVVKPLSIPEALLGDEYEEPEGIEESTEDELEELLYAQDKEV